MIPFAPGFFSPKIFAALEVGDDPFLVSLAVGGFDNTPNYDRNNSGGLFYASYQAAPADMLYHYNSSFGGSDSYTQSGTLTQAGYFDADRTMALYAGNTSWTGDYAELDIEFMTASETVRAALRMRRSAEYKTQLSYGPSLSSLTNCTLSGDGANYVQGDLTFTSSSMIFTRTRADYYNDSFTLGGLTMSDVTKIRYSNGYVFAGSISGTSLALLYLRVTN